MAIKLIIRYRIVVDFISRCGNLNNCICDEEFIYFHFPIVKEKSFHTSFGYVTSILTDEQLVAQYQRSQGLKGLGYLYERHMDLVYGVCLKYLKEPALAQDAVMNIFEELVAKLH